jgi:4-amino-4-deoxy-L-arabinose transferase-like glycosyltransferase
VRSDTTSAAGRRDAIALLVPLVTLLAGAALRIAQRPARDFDEHVFLNVARHIVDTGLPVDSYTHPGAPHLFFDHTPLYVYFVAMLTAIGGPTVLIARASSLVFGLLTVAVVFLIGRQVRGRGSAFVASVLVASNPFFITYSWFVRMEVPLCFCLVLGLYLLLNERFFLAGIAIAFAVMLKEIALAFWLVAVVYVFARRGARAAAMVGFPAPVAVAVWLAYAASLDLDQLLATLSRWGRSTVGTEPTNRRFQIGPLTWAGTVLGEVIGPLLIFAAGACGALAATRRAPIPSITVVPLAYVVLAIVASFLISLKEPRFLIAVVPMMAISIALLVDWDEAWARVRSPARA